MSMLWKNSEDKTTQYNKKDFKIIENLYLFHFSVIKLSVEILLIIKKCKRGRNIDHLKI